MYVDDMGTQYDTMLDNLTQSVALQHAVIETSIFQFLLHGFHWSVLVFLINVSRFDRSRTTLQDV